MGKQKDATGKTQNQKSKKIDKHMPKNEKKNTLKKSLHKQFSEKKKRLCNTGPSKSKMLV